MRHERTKQVFEGKRRPWLARSVRLGIEHDTPEAGGVECAFVSGGVEKEDIMGYFFNSPFELHGSRWDLKGTY